MTGTASASHLDRVLERRQAVALARHYREFEGLSIGQIADRPGRSSATIKAYFYDPTGAKARAVKARYVGLCRGCGAYTQPRNGKGDAYAYCEVLSPWRDRAALDSRTSARGDARVWRELYGQLPSSYDWSPTHARRRGEEALDRLTAGDWPAASVITDVFGSLAGAQAAVGVTQDATPQPRDSKRHP